MQIDFLILFGIQLQVNLLEDLEHHGVTYDDLIDYWKITEPSQALPKVQKENILLISGKHDLYVHSEDTDYLWEAWEKPTRYIYTCGHAGIVLKRKKLQLILSILFKID